LNLSHNDLRGKVPASITNLTALCVIGKNLPNCASYYDTDFGYNLLNVPQPEPPQSFMYQKDPDWALTQKHLKKIYLPAILK